MTTSLREECEVDSSSSNTISLFLLETDTQSQHTSSLKECQTVLPLKDCAGRENGVNGSEMLLTVLRTQVRFLPFLSCFLLLQFSGPCQKLRMFLSGSTKCWKLPFSLFLSFEKWLVCLCIGPRKSCSHWQYPPLYFRQGVWAELAWAELRVNELAWIRLH